MAKASAMQGKETKFWTVDPRKISRELGSVKIQARPAAWIPPPPFHEASVLQIISDEVSARVRLQDTALGTRADLRGCAASHSLRETMALPKTSVAEECRCSKRRWFREVHKFQQIHGNAFPVNPYGGREV